MWQRYGMSTLPIVHPALNMGTNFDLQAHADLPPVDRSVAENQDDYPMMDTSEDLSGVDGGSMCDLGSEDLSISRFLTHHEDPLDYRLGASHMLILDRLSATVPDHPSYEANGFADIFNGPPQVPIYGNDVSQSSRYWEFMQVPQSVPPRQSNEVCPRPTYLPSGSNTTLQSIGNPWMDPLYLRVAAACNQPPSPNCDHTRCYPPLDVGFLRRRFPENENWVRARAAAVASLSCRRRGFYSLPIEIIKMILEQIPVINPLTSSKVWEGFLEVDHRHKAFRTLAATSRRLRAIFYEQSWETRALTQMELPMMPGFFKQPEGQAVAPHVRRLVVDLPKDSTSYLKECLLALPSLHTLEIVDTTYSITGLVKNDFRGKPDFPNIRKVTIPLTAHPILARLPNVEELFCFGNPSRSAVRPLLGSLRGPYIKERNGEVEPILKSFTVISTCQEWKFAEALVKKHPRLRKVCLPEPTIEDMVHLSGLKEITELEIFVDLDQNRWGRQGLYDVNQVKPWARNILQASECHQHCVCKHECGCAETGKCDKCNPPKRIFRIKTCPSGLRDRPNRVVVDEGSCLEEIEVLPQRTPPTE